MPTALSGIQQIVDTWPQDGRQPRPRRLGKQLDYDQRRAFDEYLVPNIEKRYAG